MTEAPASISDIIIGKRFPPQGTVSFLSNLNGTKNDFSR